MRVALGSDDQMNESVVTAQHSALSSEPEGCGCSRGSVLSYPGPGLLFFYIGRRVIADTDKTKTPNERRKLPGDTEERRTRALEQIASTLTQIHHKLIQVRVQAANVNVTLARKR